MGALGFLYGTRLGRILLAPLVSRPVSLVAGAFLDTALSKPLIGPFVRHAGINLDEFEVSNPSSFNDFFTRRIKEGLRPVEMDPGMLVAPCDGLLSAYRIEGGLVVPVKQSEYSIAELLRDDDLARGLEGGYCLVFRLCVDHYHRYIYPVDGEQEVTVRIPGVYHTVRPVALGTRPVFVQNAREVTVIRGEHGVLAHIEVGALLVGRIVNHVRVASRVARGQEKGMFEYGGSTVILLVESGSWVPFEGYLDGDEHPVRLGEAIARLP